MNDDLARRDVVRTLARQVLELDRDPIHPLPAEIGHAEVRLDLRAMVHGISRHILISQAQIAAQVERKVKEAMTEEAIEQQIAEAVTEELARMRYDIIRRVKERIEKEVDRAIDERLGRGPAILAKKITDKMWATFSNVGRKSNVYGRTDKPRSKKR